MYIHTLSLPVAVPIWFVDAVDAGRTHTHTDLDTRGYDGVGIRRGDARAAQVLVEQVLEFGALALEPRGAHVGDVIRDDLNIELLGQHAGSTGIERTHVRTDRKSVV